MAHAGGKPAATAGLRRSSARSWKHWAAWGGRSGWTGRVGLEDPCFEGLRLADTFQLLAILGDPFYVALLGSVFHLWVPWLMSGFPVRQGSAFAG